MSAPTRTPKASNGKVKAVTPIRETGVFSSDSGDNRNLVNRLLIGTPTRGMVRMEWHLAIRQLVIPANWSNGYFCSTLPDTYVPFRYTVAHAQNIIVKYFIENNYEFLLLIEDDTIPPPDLFILLNEYLRDGPPVVSGLYFQKTLPIEPLIYRGRGNGAFTDFKPGEKVWADGVATGCILIHRSVLELMYNESREYEFEGGKLREVFLDPRQVLVEPDSGAILVRTGTSDLQWCQRVIEEDVLKRAGWPKIGRKRFPFLVDTRIACQHITPEGVRYPPN
jgi:hypothetical protein